MRREGVWNTYREVRAVGPASDTEQCLHVAIFLLQEVELFDAAVGVVPSFAPAVIRVVLLQICVGVTEIDFTGFGSYICEGVEDMGQFICW